MSIRRRISNMLFGLSVPQEYVCLSEEILQNPFSFYITTRKKHILIDITTTHLFLGYKPVIIGIQTNLTDNYHQDLVEQDQVCLSVLSEPFDFDAEWEGFQTSRNAVARMVLRKTNTVSFGSTKVILFQAQRGVHTFISRLHQSLNNLRQKAKRKRKDNIDLDENLADQVRIAYAIPRVISVITVASDDGKINIFPTDLHGPVADRFYLSSLRIGGKACEQVAHASQIVISDVDANSFNDVYLLGKNHMKDFRKVDEFNVSGLTEQLSIPIPSYATYYRELKVTGSTDIGLHRIYSYEQLNAVKCSFKNRLSHVHQYAAQWRIDHTYKTPALFRS